MCSVTYWPVPEVWQKINGNGRPLVVKSGTIAQNDVFLIFLNYYTKKEVTQSQGSLGSTGCDYNHILNKM